jgi:hypothetical protein
VTAVTWTDIADPPGKFNEAGSSSLSYTSALPVAGVLRRRMSFVAGASFWYRDTTA